MASDLRITVLGSGTSVGIPTVRCRCAVCTSSDPRDKRLRPSVLVTFDEGDETRNVLIDTTPDFRQQALSAGFERLDAVLYTHEHADHIMGLDDVRPFNYGRDDRIPAYADKRTLDNLLRAFPYAFKEIDTHPGGVPRLDPREITGDSIPLHGLDFQPVPVHHGRRMINAFRFGRAAYVTDNSDIPPESVPQLEDLDVLFLDALRRDPHPSHSSLPQALEWVERLRPKRAFLTHICHDIGHASTEADLPDNVYLAYDGLVIETHA